MRLLNVLAAFTGAILCVIALLVLGGCASTGPHTDFRWDKGFLSVSIAILSIVAACGIVAGLRCFMQLYVEMSTSTIQRILYGVVVLVLVAIFLGGALTGCAALPMPLQPRNAQGFDSSAAEGAFIVLAGVDTAQTMHIRAGTDCGYEADPAAAALYGSKNPSPGKVLGINLLMITAHTMVASWLDDKVAAESSKNDSDQPNNLGPWYVGRIAFHAISLIAEGAAVANNVKHGCKL